MNTQPVQPTGGNRAVQIRAVVVPGVTDANRGDQALVWEAVALLDELGAERSSAVVDVGEGEERHVQTAQSKREGYRILRRILPHPRRGRHNAADSVAERRSSVVLMALRGALDFVWGNLVLLVARRPALVRLLMRAEAFETYTAIRGAGTLCVKGGGFLHAYGGISAPYYIWYQLFYLRLAHRLGVPVVVLPNSFGPFRGRFVRGQVRRVLGKAAYVAAREGVSAAQLAEVLGRAVPVSPDMAHYLAPSPPDVGRRVCRQAGVPLDAKPCVGITVRPYRFPGDPDPLRAYENYIASVASLVRHVISRGFHPVLITQVAGPGAHEDDRLAIADVVRSVPDAALSVIDFPGTCRDLKAVYGSMSYVVGTRFHSVIFAQDMGVPSLAIAYGGNKAMGIMQGIGLDRFVIPIESVSPAGLIERFDLLVRESEAVSDRLTRWRSELLAMRRTLLDAVRPYVNGHPHVKSRRCIVALDARFNDKGGVASSNHLTYERFWYRYREVFDEVVVIARLFPDSGEAAGVVTGDGVKFWALPPYVGMTGFLRTYFTIRRRVRELLKAYPDAAILLRSPSHVANVLCDEAKRLGRPYAVEVVADPYDAFARRSVDHPVRPLIRYWLTRTLRKQCAGAFATAYVTQHTLQRRYPPAPGTYTVSCSDVELPQTPVPPREPGVRRQGRDFTVLTVASLAQMYKGQDVLIDAVDRCRRAGHPVKLVFVGDGKYRPMLESLVASRGLSEHVAFRGQLAGGDPVFAEMDRADLFVLPSRTEGLPRALIEAMARGMPALGSRVGGIPELLHDDDLVTPGDAAALAQAIQDVMNDPKRMAAMAARNTARARTYDVATLRERRRRFYEYVRDADPANVVTCGRVDK